MAGYAITDSFGPRAAPCTYCSTAHWGLDLASGCGEPIFAPSSGTVSKVGDEGTYGFRLMIDHPGGFQSLYALPDAGERDGCALRSGCGGRRDREGRHHRPIDRLSPAL